MGVSHEVEELIDGARLSAHLATCAGGRPHVAPVWYLYEDGVVSFLTGGRKVENIRENPRVSLSIEDADPGKVHWSVTLFGTARIVEDRDRIDAFRERLYEKYYDPGGESGGQPLVSVSVGSDTHTVY